MRAALCNRYGGPEVIKIKEVPTPVPKAHEVLVRVRATTVSAGDHRVRASDMPKGFGAIGRLGVGLRGPRQPILGNDLAGDVTAVGAKVTQFQVGDRVVAGASATHAEYTVVHEDKGIVKQPANLSYEDAASLVFGGLTAVYYLRDLVELKSGQRVLINGASGAVGTASVQLAKHLGAHVTGVCSTVNVRLVKGLGADEVIDYKRESFLERGQTYDVIFDTVGTTTYRQCKSALTKKGVYLTAVGTPGQVLRTAVFPKGRVRAGVALAKKDRMQYLMSVVESGGIKPVIDRTFSLAKIADAHQHVDTGHKKGSVVVKVA